MPPYKPVVLRLWEKITILTPDKCWVWNAAKTRQGYGIIGINGRPKLAHREVYKNSIGPIENGECVMHICDNPSCCNPAHLKTGTVLDNNKDRHDKNRSRGKSHKGENNPQAKLTEKDVIEIYQMKKTLKDIAEIYNIKFQTVSSIKNGQSWGWLTSTIEKNSHRAGSKFQ